METQHAVIEITDQSGAAGGQLTAGEKKGKGTQEGAEKERYQGQKQR